MSGVPAPRWPQMGTPHPLQSHCPLSRPVPDPVLTAPSPPPPACPQCLQALGGRTEMDPRDPMAGWPRHLCAPGSIPKLSARTFWGVGGAKRLPEAPTYPRSTPRPSPLTPPRGALACSPPHSPGFCTLFSEPKHPPISSPSPPGEPTPTSPPRPVRVPIPRGAGHAWLQHLGQGQGLVPSEDPGRG